MSRTVSGRCLLCCQLVTVSGQLQLMKFFFSSIRLLGVICVQLVYQHHKLQRIQLYTSTDTCRQRGCTPVQVTVQWEYAQVYI